MNTDPTTPETTDPAVAATDRAINEAHQLNAIQQAEALIREFKSGAYQQRIINAVADLVSQHMTAQLEGFREAIRELRERNAALEQTVLELSLKAGIAELVEPQAGDRVVDVLLQPTDVIDHAKEEAALVLIPWSTALGYDEETGKPQGFAAYSVDHGHLILTESIKNVQIGRAAVAALAQIENLADCLGQRQNYYLMAQVARGADAPAEVAATPEPAVDPQTDETVSAEV